MASVVSPPGRLAVLGLLAVVFSASAVHAGDDKVTVSVIAILASDQNTKVSKKLTGIAAQGAENQSKADRLPDS